MLNIHYHEIPALCLFHIDSHIYTLKGVDPDNDPLVFGKRPSHDSEVIRIENTGGNEANVYLAKELDREVGNTKYSSTTISRKTYLLLPPIFHCSYKTSTP